METIKAHFQVDRKEICYIRYTLESYDGMAVVTTVNPGSAVIQVLISPGCQGLVSDLLWSLVNTEGIKMDPVDPSDPSNPINGVIPKTSGVRV